MVIAGFGALASLGLALPTGLAFGYGYGYGVRQGYHAFRPSKSTVTRDLHLNANPIKGAHGAGLLSAEEMTSKQSIQAQPVLPSKPQPTPATTGQSLVTPPGPIKRAEVREPKPRFDPNNPYSFKRWEAGAIVATIPKDLAKARMRKAGLPDDDRTTNRHFVKQLYPFNTRAPSRR